MKKFYLILNKLDRNKIKDIKKELDMIWKFMIFIEIFKKIKDEKMDGENRKSLRLINRFLQKNSFLLNLSSDKILNKINKSVNKIPYCYPTPIVLSQSLCINCFK